MTTSCTRSQRRRLTDLQRDVGRVTDADAKFFERFPARSFRLRLASSAEIEQNAAAIGMASTPPVPGWRTYTVVRQIVPGIRIRVQVEGLDGADVDLTDDEVRRIYEEAVPPGSHAASVETQMRAALEKLGSGR